MYILSFFLFLSLSSQKKQVFQRNKTISLSVDTKISFDTYFCLCKKKQRGFEVMNTVRESR